MNLGWAKEYIAIAEKSFLNVQKKKGRRKYYETPCIQK